MLKRTKYSVADKPRVTEAAISAWQECLDWVIEVTYNEKPAKKFIRPMKVYRGTPRRWSWSINEHRVGEGYWHEWQQERQKAAI